LEEDDIEIGLQMAISVYSMSSRQKHFVCWVSGSSNDKDRLFVFESELYLGRERTKMGMSAMQVFPLCSPEK
jgi:hypothetical protein